MRSNVALFIHMGRLTHTDLAKSFVLLAPRLLRFREKYAPPFIAKAYRPVQKTPFRTVVGDIKMILTLAQWKAEQGR